MATPTVPETQPPGEENGTPPSGRFDAGKSLLPTVEEIIATLDEVRWSVAMDCLHHEKLTEHGRWVLTYASDALRMLTPQPP